MNLHHVYECKVILTNFKGLDCNIWSIYGSLTLRSGILTLFATNKIYWECLQVCVCSVKYVRDSSEERDVFLKQSWWSWCWLPIIVCNNWKNISTIVFNYRKHYYNLDLLYDTSMFIKQILTGIILDYSRLNYFGT